ncbi:hypothetical protein QQF64_035787 [Cirrhinus molitorella]|uniref:Uncharacterized protein n=1 Tax=Cirrhinus molitorella TaxID=172907 RepID=A0ABR3NGR2_9TELE
MSGGAHKDPQAEVQIEGTLLKREKTKISSQKSKRSLGDSQKQEQSFSEHSNSRRSGEKQSGTKVDPTKTLVPKKTKASRGVEITVRAKESKKAPSPHTNSVKDHHRCPAVQGTKINDPTRQWRIRKHRRLTDAERGKISAAGREREATKSLISRQAGSQASVGHERSKRQ